MDSRPPYPSGSYFFTKSGSYIIDVSHTDQEQTQRNGVKRSNSTPPVIAKDDFEHETNETKFYSEDEERSHSRHARELQRKRSSRLSESRNSINENSQQGGTEQPENPDNTGEGGEEKPKLKFSQMPGRSKYTFIMVAIANFGAGCGFSLPAPFFPREAVKKDVSQTVIGLVFSSFQLVNFIASPIFGNYLTVLGAKFVYSSGIMVTGCTAILFGFLDQGPSGTIFIVMSFLVRSIEALGVSAFVTASFAIISNEFPNHIASVFATLETCFGIGLMVGPTIGGALYEVGGFGLPFWVVGAVIVTSGLAIFACLPVPKDTTVKRQGNVFYLLKSPMVWVTMLCIMGGSCGIAFLDPTLSGHLEQFGLSTILVGLFFVIVPGIYAILAPLWGYLSDTKDIQSPLLIGGSLVCAIGFLFMGPSPLLPFLPRELWTVTLGLVFFGITVGSAIVPTLKCFVIGARDLGLADNLNTFGLVSGLFNSVFFLGAFVGPTVGGALVDQIGFYYASTIIAGFYLVAMIVSAIYFGQRRYRRKRSKLSENVAADQNSTPDVTSNEKAPLISSTKSGMLENSYTATNTQLELSEKTHKHAAEQTQANGFKGSRK